MESGSVKTELKKIIYLCMITCMTILSIMLIVLDRLLDWEIWMLPVIVTGAAMCWMLYIMDVIPQRAQIYTCGAFSMFLVFYYCIKINTSYDCGTVIVIMIFLFAFTREKPLLWFGIAGSFLSLIFHLLVVKNTGGLNMGRGSVVRTVMVFMVIPLAALIIERLVSAWDVSEKRYLEQIDALAEENGRVNSFLANVSHEIRTPIGAVLGLSYVLENEDLPESALDKMQSITEAGHRASEQINDILDFTEIDMKNVAVSHESYMPGSLVNDLLVQLDQTDNFGLDLVVDIDVTTPARLIGDEAKIRRVMWHLIRNGYKYTKEGGVCLRIYPVKRDYGINLMIEVRDTGVGISEEELDNVYDKFYQVDSGRSRTKGGLGLGIPIVNGFVKAMGGVLTIESRPNEGTAVKVSIPQEVEDPTPSISVRNNKTCVVGGFLGFMTTGHPKVREYYMQMIAHLSAGLSIQLVRVQSRQELEKVVESAKLTHLFVGTGEYLNNREYIDQLAKQMNVALVADRGFDGDVTPGLTVLPKPFYGSQVADFLNQVFTGGNIDTVEYLTTPGLKTLVVDDEHMNLVVGREIFSRYGMEVMTAGSGQEAVDLCRENDFTLVFMDHMMPGMDGVEAMHRIRQDAARANREIRVIALTANAISSAREMFFAEGFDGFVPKPIQIPELERELRRVLPKSAIVFTREPRRRRRKGAAAPEPAAKAQDLPAAEPAAPQAVPDAPADRYAALKALGVDTAYGIDYCGGDTGFYDELLGDYVDKKDERLAVLREYFDNRDWKNYEIRVHSIKSTSALLGAAGISEAAKALETAAKGGDEAFITEHHAGFMDDYAKLLAAIAELLG
ncbi:MAG: response regulator [Lachnospiraceae bacterium]|nr:response regulator [Lachnospiraceae bacterium]